MEQREMENTASFFYHEISIISIINITIMFVNMTLNNINLANIY